MKELIKKTGLLMLMLMAGLSFASCSDDDEGISIPNDLVGTWKVTSSYYAEYGDGDLWYEHTDNEVGQVWKLDANGSISMNNYNVGTWGVSGNQFLVTKVSGDEMDTERFTLTRNGNDEVTIKYDITYKEDGSTYREVYSLTLVRQSTSGGQGDGNGGNGGGNGTIIPSDLVGTWTVTSSSYVEYKNGDLWTNYTDDEVGQVWKLNANGSISMNDHNVGTWSVSGNQFLVTTTDDGETYTERFTLTRNGNDEVTIKYDNTYNESGSTYREVYSLTLSRN